VNECTTQPSWTKVHTWCRPDSKNPLYVIFDQQTCSVHGLIWKPMWQRRSLFTWGTRVNTVIDLKIYSNPNSQQIICKIWFDLFVLVCYFHVAYRWSWAIITEHARLRYTHERSYKSPLCSYLGLQPMLQPMSGRFNAQYYRPPTYNSKILTSVRVFVWTEQGTCTW